MTGWAAVLNGVGMAGDTAPSGVDATACLTQNPDGMGVPGLRVEDVIYPQRDGVRHFSDWYQPRIVTFSGVTICPDDCPTCPSARVKARDLMLAWSRHCDDAELVVYTDCHDPSETVTGADRALVGPYGVIGRPRVAQLGWMTGDSGCAVALLRFDAVDHRLYVLDAAGTPGSGEQCLTLNTEIDSACRTYPRCYDACSPGVTGWSYSTPITGTGGPLSFDNFGTLCAQPTITFYGPLTNPQVENITTGVFVEYTTSIPAGGSVTIDTDAGTAVDQDGNPVTGSLEGDLNLMVDLGVNEFRLTSNGPGDTGTVEVCFRPSVLSG